MLYNVVHESIGEWSVVTGDVLHCTLSGIWLSFNNPSMAEVAVVQHTRSSVRLEWLEDECGEFDQWDICSRVS